ncbi:aminodeoxychorismate synthase component I [Vibrio hippocampi]|uniref:aminodeoxychorismate synthase n=1 Tax=Vibrio hippocampi TaxID=654686 RepID=A0ABN8DIC8_9VIBR|nr:aminodeoxychorismate synthase component I [Vibrio hippocampi]CAH0525628.1 Aminodeoxychorismate synthase component 1 [Vibrio hippocampi]
MNNKQPLSCQFLSLDYSPELAKDYFALIQHLPWSMLLNSSGHQHENSRFDILVAQPCATVVTRGESSHYTSQGQQQQTNRDPFQLLQSLIQIEIGEGQVDTPWPFVGGALGYFAYDLGRRVETIPTLASNDTQTADMSVGIYRCALMVDHQQQQAVVVAPTIEQAQQFLAWLTQSHAEKDGEFCLQSPWQSNMDKTRYSDKIASVHRYLQSGDCYQINLAQRFHAQYQGSEWQAYQRLDRANNAPFSAFIRTDDSAILSVSPERFLQLDQHKIETKPIKGTRPRGQTSEEDQANAAELASASKDQAENLMIVDLLRNDIGRVSKPGSVQVPKLFEIESFSAVHHLVSTVVGELDKQYRACDLLRACFPGGSITGAPKVRAMEIIEELEPNRRSVYCGSIGYISAHGKMDTSITIRTLLAKQGKLYAWAGGGIVADSQWESEYQETFDKLSKILPVLQNESV